MRSHEIDYRIYGNDLQFVEVELDPGEVVVAEAGAMMYMEQGITFEAKMGDGSDPDQGTWGKLKSAAKRGITGEGLFMTHFTNSAPQGKQRVAMAAPYPGKILPINLAAAGGNLLAQKDAFLCAASGTKLDIAFNRKIGTGIFGGEGFILQSISGDGLAFLHAGGTIVEKQLQGETLRIDTGCIVGLPAPDPVLDRAGREPQVDGLRRRGPVPGHPHRRGPGVAPVAPVQPHSRPCDRQPEAGRLPGRGLGHGRPVEHVRALAALSRLAGRFRACQTIGMLNEPSGPKSKRKSSPAATAIGRVNDPDRITSPVFSDRPCSA